MAAAGAKDRAVVLALLPLAQMMIGLYFYSCLPLHLVKTGLELIHMGLTCGAALCMRMVLSLVAVRHVALEKLVLPTLVLPLTSGLLGSAFPDSAGLIYLNVFCVMMLPSRCVFQACGQMTTDASWQHTMPLPSTGCVEMGGSAVGISKAAAVQVWPAERTKALRMYEGFYTIGYCLSSLWGATLYHLGGWKLCVWCQVGVLAAALVLACTVDTLRPRCRRVRGAAQTTADKKAAQAVDNAAGKAEADASKRQEPSRSCWSWWLPLFVCMGPGVLIFAYASEWSIYLVYLTDVFEISPLWIGIGQMAGDVGGAAILMLSMLSNSRPSCTTLNKNAAACGSCLSTLPFSMVWLGALNALSYLAFLSPRMEVAICGQVLMGTLYVLNQQGSSEIVDWCSSRHCSSSSGADARQSSYQSYAAMADAFFCFGCCVGSVLPYVMLEELSAAWVCYAAAGAIAAYYGAFALVFLFVGGMRAPAAEPSTPPAPDL